MSCKTLVTLVAATLMSLLAPDLALARGGGFGGGGGFHGAGMHGGGGFHGAGLHGGGFGGGGGFHGAGVAVHVGTIGAGGFRGAAVGGTSGFRSAAIAPRAAAFGAHGSFVGRRFAGGHWREAKNKAADAIYRRRPCQPRILKLAHAIR
jgi:hypothetical protein